MGVMWISFFVLFSTNAEDGLSRLTFQNPEPDQFSIPSALARRRFRFGCSGQSQSDGTISENGDALLIAFRNFVGHTLTRKILRQACQIDVPLTFEGGGSMGRYTLELRLGHLLGRGAKAQIGVQTSYRSQFGNPYGDNIMYWKLNSGSNPDLTISLDRIGIWDDVRGQDPFELRILVTAVLDARNLLRRQEALLSIDSIDLKSRVEENSGKE